MIGLAIGIDYSLLMVTYYRENGTGATVAEAVADTVARAGQTIAWSGVTVMIGFFGLLFSPILETRCAGIGGALVVCVSVLAALTLLPAALVLLGPYIERWSVVPPRLRLGNTTELWRRLGEWIVHHPWPTLLVSGLVRARAVAAAAQGEHRREQRALVPAARDRIPGRRGDPEHAAQRQFLARRSTPSCMPMTAQPLLAASHIVPLVRIRGAARAAIPALPRSPRRSTCRRGSARRNIPRSTKIPRRPCAATRRSPSCT